MRRRKRNIATILLVIVMVLPLSNGCAVIGIGIATVATINCIKKHNQEQLAEKRLLAQKKKKFKKKAKKCPPIIVKELN